MNRVNLLLIARKDIQIKICCPDGSLRIAYVLNTDAFYIRTGHNELKCLPANVNGTDDVAASGYQ